MMPSNENIKKVLIVDDEIDFCILIRSYLQPRGYDVHIAVNVKEGLAKLDEFNPDVIFLDNNLPDGFGWELLEYILHRFPSCKVNLMSAYGGPQGTTKLVRVKFLEKPLNLGQIIKYL